VVKSFFDNPLKTHGAIALDPLSSEQINALGSMSKEIHDEYRNLGFAGLTLDPVRFLAYREQTHNIRFTKLVVSDAGVFYLDPARKIKYRFDPDFFLLYHEGLSPEEEEKLRDPQQAILLLDNGLEFWRRPGTGLCLVKDHVNGCEFLFSERRAELDQVRRLYGAESLVLRPMLHNKKKSEPVMGFPGTSLIDLDSL